MSEAEPSSRAAKRRKMSTTSYSSTPDSSSASDGAPSAPTVDPATTAAESTSNAEVEDPHGAHDTDVEMSSELSEIPASTTVLSTSATTNANRRRLTWPSGDVGFPVEIYNMIVQHLDRGDIQNLRLVSREFDRKLAEGYFKNVVVPFRPEFEAVYGSLNIDPTRSDDQQQQQLSLVMKKKIEDIDSTATALQDQDGALSGDASVLSGGYRVFEEFGNKMLKFALALELDERDLAYPPLKPTQEVISAPWGLYRWPVLNYQRYSQLQDLEQLADETGYMRKAFQHLKDITEIGISCDAGLGWLQGPDINQFCPRTGPAVFKPVTYESGAPGNAHSAGSSVEGSVGLNSLKQMVLNAGFSAADWARVVLRLLQDEGRDGAIVWQDRLRADGKMALERIPTLPVREETTDEEIIQHIEAVLNVDSDSPIAGGSDARFGLIPSTLTSAQTEMLLELEWAHRALMQSYRIAIVDNKDYFQRLERLTIARCPSCHVKNWCNDGFWETMTSIRTFHLGVIPDWREIRKDRSGLGSTVTHERVEPVGACHIVFKLFQEYVSEQRNVKHVSFEWICGGEFAVGKSQRDRYIMPAPVLLASDTMVNVQHVFAEDEILHMPYIETLSLKNCWFTPQVFLHFFKHMSMEALAQVALESVSLTGPPAFASEPSIYPALHGAQARPTHWPWPLCVGAEPGHWFLLQRPNAPAHAIAAAAAAGGIAGAAAVPGAGVMPWAGPGLNQLIAPQPAPLGLNPNVVGNNPGASMAFNWPSPPAQLGSSGQHTSRWRAWSWPHVLASLGMASVAVGDHIDRGGAEDQQHWGNLKAKERRFRQNFERILDDRENFYKPQVFKLKSCGYALVESPNVDNWQIIPNHVVQVQHHVDLPARLRELDSEMLWSSDGMLAKVLNYMPVEEELHLRNIFGFSFGWGGIYEPIMSQVAVADGNPDPGQARFHGETDNEAAVQSEREKAFSKGKQVALRSS